MTFARSLKLWTGMLCVACWCVAASRAWSQEPSAVPPQIAQGSATFNVMPYFVLEKTEAGDEVGTYRIKIWGHGLEYSEKPTEGFDLVLARENEGRASVLSSRTLLKKVELSRDQSKEIADIRKKLLARLSAELEERFGKKEGSLSDADKSEIKELLQEISTEHDEIAWNVLVPRQQDQLRALAASQSLTLESMGSITGSVLATQLELTEEQLEQLKKIAESAKKKIDEAKAALDMKILEIKEEVKETIMDVLTPEQKKKLEELKRNVN